MGIMNASRDIGNNFDERKGGTMANWAAAGGLSRTNSDVDVAISSATPTSGRVTSMVRTADCAAVVY